MTSNTIKMRSDTVRGGVVVIVVGFINHEGKQIGFLHFEHEDMVRMPAIVENWLIRNIKPD